MGGQIDYENRIYDPRIAGWYSIDPLIQYIIGIKRAERKERRN
jgi:hypothetical protein